jgi:hypothetical protein
MTFPQQNLTIQDPGIPIVPPAATTPVITGIAIGGSGAANTILSINRKTDVRTILGYGPLAEDVALALDKRGGPILCVKHTPASAVLSGVVLTEVGSVSPPAVTVSGTPTDRFKLLVTIVAGGAVATSTFTFSLDAHDADAAPFTISAVRATAATYVIPNSGLTLTFPAGTYVAGDTYSLACTPPEPTTTDLGTVATLLEAAPKQDFHLWLLSGSQPDKVTAAAVAVALGSDGAALTTTYRYVRTFCDIGSVDTADNIHGEDSTWTNTRVCPAYGFVLRSSALPYEGFSNRKVSCVSGIAIRAMSVKISNDLARFADGPDEGVLKVYFDGLLDQRLDADGVSTMRTWPGADGFYIAGGKLKAPFGSNFTDVQYGRIMDVACKTTYLGQLPLSSDSFRTKTDGSGQIDERDAVVIEQGITDELANDLTRQPNARGTGGHVSGFKYTIDRTINMITSGQLVSKVGITPLAYAKDIETTLFYALKL